MARFSFVSTGMYLMLFIFGLLVWFVGAVAVYRCGAFVHEIVHQRFNKDFDPKFTIYWNFIHYRAIFPDAVNEL